MADPPNYNRQGNPVLFYYMLFSGIYTSVQGSIPPERNKTLLSTILLSFMDT